MSLLLLLTDHRKNENNKKKFVSKGKLLYYNTKCRVKRKILYYNANFCAETQIFRKENKTTRNPLHAFVESGIFPGHFLGIVSTNQVGGQLVIPCINLIIG